MYDATSRSVLGEKLGYERFALHECSLAMRRHYGSVDSREVIIEGDSIHLFMRLSDHVRAHHGALVVQNLSALLFGACYKTLDMIFEWIIEENNIVPSRTFAGKIDQLENHLANFTLPPSLDQQTAEVLFALFGNLREERNAITHRAWGSVLNGDLHFRTETIINFSEVMAFADAMVNLADDLVAPTSTQERIIAAKVQLNVLQPHHRSHSFNIFSRPHANITYKISSTSDTPAVVDLKRVREADEAAHFTLTVEVSIHGQITRWRFDSNELIGQQSITLDSTWDDHRI